MRTVSAFIEDYIKTKPFLLSALADQIINLTSLARKLRPEAEEDLGKPIKTGAIVMALNRVADQLEFTTNYRIIKALKSVTEINIRSQLTGYTFLISDTIFECKLEILKEIKGLKDTFYNSSRGNSETNIVISTSLENHLENIFKEETRILKTSNLSSISIKLPKDNINIPGLYFFIFQKLAWEGINVNEVISTTNEFTIVIQEDYFDSAIKVIKGLKNL